MRFVTWNQPGIHYDDVNLYWSVEGASVFFDGTLVHLSFGIPRGMQGEQGIQGPPGEVTIAALATAIADTARNPSGIAPFGGTFSDPPTQAEMQAFAAWSEALRAALVR